jgi:hypothetical protein
MRTSHARKSMTSEPFLSSAPGAWRKTNSEHPGPAAAPNRFWYSKSILVHCTHCDKNNICASNTFFVLIFLDGF